VTNVLDEELTTNMIRDTLLPPPSYFFYLFDTYVRLPGFLCTNPIVVLLPPSEGLNGPWFSTEALVRSTECDLAETYDSHTLRC
jgi:hypothetical protein